MPRGHLRRGDPGRAREPEHRPLKPKIKRRRPLQGRSKDTVEVLLQTLAQILVTEGHERVTTNEIARRAGVSIGSLYQYFPDKSAMMKEILSRQLDKRRQVIMTAIEEGRHKPLPDLFRIILHGVLDAQKVSPRLYQALAAYGDQPMLEAFDRDVEVMIGALLRTTVSPIRPRDPDLAAMITVRAFTGLVRTSFQRDPGWARRPEVEEEIVTFALRYLLPDD